MKQNIVAIVGLGYVGLPLAVEFGKKFETIGYDLSESKIANYKKYIDPTREVSKQDFLASFGLKVTNDPSEINRADFVIIAVPTPVDAAHQPDFSPLVKASTTVGKYLKRGAIVIYESTVYPGATEDICIPILEQESGLKWKKNFHVGYSPERVNPGDKEKKITKIIKVVSGDELETLDKIAKLYESIIDAGVYRASSIKVAEAAKVIENTQRDLNIALMNELSIIFSRIGIDTLEVLEAAGTKWNFLPFRPGLVGGHCIGVDPYYLTHKAEMIGYHPEVILAGRRINDGMASFIAQQTGMLLIRAGYSIKTAKIIVLGLTFKENCPDLRNSKVADVVYELQNFGWDVSVHDPIADPKDAIDEYGISLMNWADLPSADAIVAAVSHKEYLELPFTDLLGKLKPGGVFVDVKSVYDPVFIQSAGYNLWRL
ncbi:nucleotide sugar dehydrogenase [Methylosarcina fibrata]|uniref:nucleotide sugar dehydrogenase n=1 Tax=Methylosarcina fibrata TaxID=105972 RepID=UPI000380C708|nr:nucleotide sugar dehydrogenase [Methylosarcina fibrata]